MSIPILNVRLENGAELADRCVVADRWWSRTRGLLGRSALEPGEALLIRPCSSIHMIGMRFAIDAAFLDADGVVLALSPGLAPGFTIASRKGAAQVLELPAGTIAGAKLRVGDLLLLG
jgi:uncharacterized protein